MHRALALTTTNSVYSFASWISLSFGFTQLNDGTTTNLDDDGHGGLTTCRIKRHTGLFSRAETKKYFNCRAGSRASLAFITCANHVRVLNTRDVPSRNV